MRWKDASGQDTDGSRFETTARPLHAYRPTTSRGLRLDSLIGRWLNRWIAEILPCGDDERRGGQFAHSLHESSELESDAGSLFVFLLFKRPGLVRQQLTEGQIGLPQSVHLTRVEVIANEPEDVSAPFVPLRFIFTDVIRQERLVFGQLVGRSLPLALPSLGAPEVARDSFVQQRSQFLSSQGQFQDLRSTRRATLALSDMLGSSIASVSIDGRYVLGPRRFARRL